MGLQPPGPSGRWRRLREDRRELPGDAKQLHDQLADLYDIARKEPQQFVWIGLFEPWAAELALVGQVFDLEELQVDDAANHLQRPKVELDGHGRW